MLGFEQFLKLFSNITILNVVEVILAGIFLLAVYKKFKEHMIKIHDAEQKREEQLQEALGAVRKYPEYRQQSVQIQQQLESQIQALRKSQEQNEARLKRMEELSERRERNKLRELLLQNYRYYTNKETNPSQSWTQMESETFWELFSDYEQAGGNGYMHTDVEPVMRRLLVVPTKTIK